MVNKLFTCPNGHQWSSDGGLKWCPVCGQTVGHGNSHLDSTGTGPDSGSYSTAEWRPSRFGRYKIVEELGLGGMGIVYRAFDPLHEREVALKILPSTEPRLLSRFKREFRALTNMDHPNVVKLFELTSDGGTWFFTMEIIDGVDFLNYVRFGNSQKPTETPDGDALGRDSELLITQEFNSPRLSEDLLHRLRRGLAQLVGAIAALHAKGILHRDIKPSNVMVTPDERTVLLDFGLIAETDPSGSHQSLHQQIMGTVAYMSPEQAGCDPVSPASDWYSVGVMLYRALTGKLPFSGKRIDVLANKQRQDPVPPCEIEPSIPQDLNDLCMDLLCRRPEGRPGAEDILQRLGKQSHERAPRKESQANEFSLVGRDRHLRTLHDAYQVMLGGRAQIVFVQGRSGDGKSALCEAFVQQAMGAGAVVLKGRCYEMESVPFKAIDSVIDALVSHLGRLSREEAEALMPRDIRALVRLFPVIGQIEAVASLPRRQIDISDQQELKRRAIGALRELLARMGDRCPLVVYIDDLQWGDEDSAAMLSDLLQPPDAPVILFLGTYRSEDTDTSQFLQSFRQIQRQRELPLEWLEVDVTPLEHSDAVKLALALLGRADVGSQVIAESIARDAAGNPLFVSELVKHVHLQGDDSANSTEPSVLVDMIWSRVRRLPDESQRLLTVVALRGQPLPLDQALHIANVGQSAIGPLRTGHLIRTLGLASLSKIETYHDRVRESVSSRLDQVTKQQYHLRIAEELARQSPLDISAFMVAGSAQTDDQIEIVPEWYDVAFHFDAAGRSDLAFPYALATAEQARAQFSLEVAEQQYRIAQRGEGRHDLGTRYRVAEGLGDVLMLRGRYPAAAKIFEAARSLTKDSLTRARIEGSLGELAFKQGDNKAAFETLERSLRLLGRRVPSHSLMFALFLAWEVLVQTLHTILPRLFLARRSLQGSESELLAVRLYIRLSYAYFFDRLIPCFWAHLRAFNLIERYPPTRELSHVWASHAPAMSLIPWLRRGEVYAKKSLEIRKDLGDVCGQGQSLHYWGVVLFTGARFDDCIDKCTEAVRLLERTGDYWERNMALWQSANATYRKGELARAITAARHLYEVASEMGDDKVAGFILDVWSRASGGQLPADIAQQEMEKERNDVQATAQVRLAEAVRLVGQGELDEAVKVLTHAREVCREARMMNAWVSPVLPWLATTYRLQWQSSTDLVPHRRRQLLKNARRAARQALSVARKFNTDLPHALREAGLITAMQGKIRKARQHFAESLAVAARQGAKFEHAQTLLARGSVGRNVDWPGAEEEVAAARQALIELGADFVLTHPMMPE